jgi:hypothetical protein
MRHDFKAAPLQGTFAKFAAAWCFLRLESEHTWANPMKLQMALTGMRSSQR